MNGITVSALNTGYGPLSNWEIRPGGLSGLVLGGLPSSAVVPPGFGGRDSTLAVRGHGRRVPVRVVTEIVFKLFCLSRPPVRSPNVQLRRVLGSPSTSTVPCGTSLSTLPGSFSDFSRSEVLLGTFPTVGLVGGPPGE